MYSCLGHNVLRSETDYFFIFLFIILQRFEFLLSTTVKIDKNCTFFLENSNQLILLCLHSANKCLETLYIKFIINKIDN